MVLKNIPLFSGFFQKRYETLLMREMKKLRKKAITSRKTFDSIVFFVFFDIGKLQKSFDKITKFIINGKLKNQNNLHFSLWIIRREQRVENLKERLQNS